MYIVPITNMTLNMGVAKHYYVDVTAGQTVSCWTNGLNRDADLYLLFGVTAVRDSTSTKNACSSYSGTSNESCSNITVLVTTKV
jgi:serine protease